MFLERGILELKRKRYIDFNATMLIVLFIISTVYAIAIVSDRAINRVCRYGYEYHGLDAASINLTPNTNQSGIVVVLENAVRLFINRQNSWTVSELLGPIEDPMVDDYYACLAVGEIYPSEVGEEIVVVSRCGKVIVLKNSNSNWSSTLIYDDYIGKSLKVAIGDLDPENSGNEIVVAGTGMYYSETLWPGIVTILSHEEDGTWNATEIKVTYAVHSLVIGDFDSLHYGNECIIRETLGKIEVIFLDSNKWYVQQIWDLRDYFYSMASGDVYPTHLGDEVLVLNGSKAFLLYRDEQVNWTLTPIGEDPNGNRLTNIAVEEVGTSGNCAHIVTGSISSELYELYFNGSTWKRKTLIDLKPYTSIYWDMTRIIMSDSDSGHQGNEIIIVTDTGIVRVMSLVYRRNLLDRIFVSLPLIGLGFVSIGVLNLSFLVFDLRQKRFKKLEERGYKKCPICGSYIKSNMLNEHIALHLPDGKD